MSLITYKEKVNILRSDVLWGRRLVNNRRLLFYARKSGYVATYGNKWALYATVEQLLRTNLSAGTTIARRISLTPVRWKLSLNWLSNTTLKPLWLSRAPSRLVTLQVFVRSSTATILSSARSFCVRVTLGVYIIHFPLRFIVARILKVNSLTEAVCFWLIVLIISAGITWIIGKTKIGRYLTKI